MKKLIIVIVLLMFTAACSPGEQKLTEGQKRAKDAGFTSYQLSFPPEIVEIEGCEYIRMGVNGGYVYTHKGDCKNPKHKELIKEAIREVNAEQNRNQRSGN